MALSMVADELAPLRILLPLSAGFAPWHAAQLAAFSVFGDLFESQLKRLAGVKDSSHLLPGHGGVLDRVDALIPTMPIAALLAGFI